MRKIGIVYVHATKEYMRQIGEELGMTGEVLDYFHYAFNEVTIQFAVDTTKGEVEILSVDGQDVKRGE